MVQDITLRYRFYKESNIIDSAIKFWDLIHSSLNIQFDSVHIVHKNKIIDPLSQKRALILKLIEEETNLDFMNKQTNEGFLIDKDQKKHNSIIFSILVNKVTPSWIDFFKKTMMTLGEAYVAQGVDSEISSRSSRPYNKLRRSIGLSFEPEYLHWLNYFNQETMQKYGGEALYDLPHLTKAEPLGEGIFIQIGESPEDRLQPGGEERLFEATKAMWELIKTNTQ